MSFILHQNFPNPFNPVTTIVYGLPKAAHVQLTIHDIQGRQVKQLVNTQQPAGQHKVSWDATNEYSERVAAGLYFCCMEAEGFHYVTKLALVK